MFYSHTQILRGNWSHSKQQVINNVISVTLYIDTAVQVVGHGEGEVFSQLTLFCPCFPYRYLKVPMGNMGVFDPTEIHNRGQLKSHMKEAMIKLGYHLLCFFIYLYRL